MRYTSSVFPKQCTTPVTFQKLFTVFIVQSGERVSEERREADNFNLVGSSQLLEIKIHAGDQNPDLPSPEQLRVSVWQTQKVMQLTQKQTN